MASSSGHLPHLAGGQPAKPGDFLLARRHRLVLPHLPARGGALLDLGCGNGAQTFFFTSNFRISVGLDVERSFLKIYQNEADCRQLKDLWLPVAYDGARFPCADAAFDCAVSFEVLEHVQDEMAVLAELHRVLKPGGLLAISVPNRWWIFETHGARLPLLPWNRVPFFSWLPKRLHDRFARARNYRRREIAALLTAAGFTLRSSSYVTAPMDVVSWEPLRRLLRASLFAGDITRCPWLATAILSIARR